MDEAELCANIDTVSQTTEGECHPDTEDVGDGASEETDNSESGVQRTVRCVASRGIKLPCAADAIESVEHA